MPPSALALTLTIVGLFLGGGAAGAAAGWWLGRVDWAAGVGAFAMPVGFGLSMVAWYGVGVAWVLLFLARLALSRGEARQALLGRRGADVLDPGRRRTIPGTALFAPICGGVGALAGVVIGLGREASLPGSLLVMTLLGLAYGLLMRRAARAGYLIPPESLD